MSTSLSVFSCPCVALQPLASFPTRRSSDLVPGWPGGIFVGGANVPRHFRQIRAAVGDDPRHAAQGATRAWLTLETDPPTRFAKPIPPRSPCIGDYWATLSPTGVFSPYASFALIFTQFPSRQWQSSWQ